MRFLKLIAVVPILLLSLGSAYGGQENVIPGHYEFVGFEPTMQHLGDWATYRFVLDAQSYTYQWYRNEGALTLDPHPTVVEYKDEIQYNGLGGFYQCMHGDTTAISLECYPHTTAGETARHNKYLIYQADPELRDHVVENEYPDVFYSIDLLYTGVAAWCALDDGFVHNEVCHADQFNGFGGAANAVGTQGVSPSAQERAQNMQFIWGGFNGNDGKVKRAVFESIGQCPCLVITQGDGHMTLSPIVEIQSVDEFARVPVYGLDFDITFNSLMNTLQDWPDYCSITAGNITINDGEWLNDYALRLEISGPTGTTRWGTVEIAENLQAWGNPEGDLDGDAKGPNDDPWIFSLGPDNGAGVSSLGEYNAEANTFSWTELCHDGNTDRLTVEGLWDEEWEEFASIPQRAGQLRVVNVPKPYQRVRLLEWDIGGRVTYHGSLPRRPLPPTPTYTRPSRAELKAKVLYRLDHNAPYSRPRGSGEHMLNGAHVAIVTLADFQDELSPWEPYLAYWGTITHWITVPPGTDDERRHQIKADMQYMYETYGVDIFYLGGDGNDHTMWTQQWPPPWDEIKEGYDELYPPEGEAHLNKIPVGEYIEDLDPQGYNTGYWTWWVATDDWYSDLYGDGSVYVTVSRSPFSTEEEALIETYKGMSYMDLTGYFYDLNVNEFIGDETYDNPHDGEQFVNNMNELREHFPPETYFQRLLQSDGDSWWRRDEVIDRYQYGSDANFFLGPNSSVNNKSSITWAPIFMWDMVGTCWPGMTFSPTCGQSNFCMTQRYEQQYSLSEDGLYDNFGGQVMYVGSTSGSWDDDLVAFYGFLLDRIFADRSIPIAVQVTLAKQDCRDAGINTLTIKSIVVLGPPWLTLNNEPHYSSVDEDPTEICLEIGRNYPNPFSSTTALSFTTTANGWVKLSVFDASGRLVRNLVNRTVEPGAHIIRWDGCNANGSTLPSGVYFSVLQAEGRSLKSMMLRVK